MRFPHPLKTLRAKRATKRQARIDALKTKLQKELDRKTVEQLQDEAIKERILAEQERASSERMMERSSKDLDRAHKTFARSLDRMAKSTRRMQALINWLTVPFILFEAAMLGRNLTQHDWNSAILDAFFVTVFSLVLLGRYFDLQREARRGAELRQELDEKNEEKILEHKLAQAKEAGRKEAEANGRGDACGTSELEDLPEELSELLSPLLEGMKDAARGKEPSIRVIEKVHEAMLGAVLKTITAEVMDEAVEKLGGPDAAKKAGFQPTDEHAREIKRRFKEAAHGHTVELEWKGNGWAAEINVDHDTGQSPKGEAPATVVARKGASQARRDAKKASKKK